MSANSAMDRLEQWWKLNRACKDVYGGSCNIRIGPPKWSHRIDRYRSEPYSHPTPEQALWAAQNPDTDTAVPERLARWDPIEHEGIVNAAANNLELRRS